MGKGQQLPIHPSELNGSLTVPLSSRTTAVIGVAIEFHRDLYLRVAPIDEDSLAVRQTQLVLRKTRPEAVGNEQAPIEHLEDASKRTLRSTMPFEDGSYHPNAPAS